MTAFKNMCVRAFLKKKLLKRLQNNAYSENYTYCTIYAGIQGNLVYKSTAKFSSSNVDVEL